MIRQAIPADVAAIRCCAERAYARYVPLVGRKPAPMSADYAAQVAAGEVHLACDTRGALLGFIVFRAEGDHALLENVAVLPEAAGRGIGKALIGHCEAVARQGGLKSVRLYTNEKMAENILIYPRLGYAEVGRRAEDGFSRVYFEKSLGRRAPGPSAPPGVTGRLAADDGTSASRTCHN